MISPSASGRREGWEVVEVGLLEEEERGEGENEERNIAAGDIDRSGVESIVGSGSTVGLVLISNISWSSSLAVTIFGLSGLVS